MRSQEAEQGASRRRCMQATLWRSCWPAMRRFWTRRIDIRLSPIYCRFVIYLFPRFLKELFVFTGSQRWIHFASVPPPSASSNEWVPVFRAQPAAMNKMAFKAFFITAFSQTERDGCRASDKSRPGGLNDFIFLMVKNLYSAYLCQNVSKNRSYSWLESNMFTWYRTIWWGRGVARLDCEPEAMLTIEKYLLFVPILFFFVF